MFYKQIRYVITTNKQGMFLLIVAMIRAENEENDFTYTSMSEPIVPIVCISSSAGRLDAAVDPITAIAPACVTGCSC